MTTFSPEEMTALKILVEYAAKHCGGGEDIAGAILYTGAFTHLDKSKPSAIGDLAKKIEGIRPEPQITEQTIEFSYFILHTFDNLFLADQFDIANDILTDVLPLIPLMDSFVVRSILSASYAAKDKLPAREAFYQAGLKHCIQLRGEETAYKILGNLK